MFGLLASELHIQPSTILSMSLPEFKMWMGQAEMIIKMKYPQKDGD